MVVPMEQWTSQPFQDKSADLWVVMLFDHNEKYSDRMERFYKAFAVTFELRFPFPLRCFDGRSLSEAKLDLLSSHQSLMIFSTSYFFPALPKVKWEILYISKKIYAHMKFDWALTIKIAKMSHDLRDHLGLTHCGLVMPYGDRDLGQHWLR